MTRIKVPHLDLRQRLALGAVALLSLGAAGGAGAVSLTRPAVEMAPTIATPIANLPTTSGLVTVRGRVAAIYGNRFIVEDRSGRSLVDTGQADGALRTGAPVLVQGRYDDGQLRAHFLADRQGGVRETGVPPRPPHGAGPAPGGPGARPGGPGGPGAPPPPPPGGPGAPPPPPAGAGAPPPPPPPAGAAQPGVGGVAPAPMAVPTPIAPAAGQPVAPAPVAPR